MRLNLHVLVWLLLSALLGMAGGVAVADVTVSAVRVGQHADKTRLVLESNQPVQPSAIFQLENPPRLVLDFRKDHPTLDFQVNLNRLELPPESKMSAMRAGRFRADTQRIVLDLTQPVRPSPFIIPGVGGKPFRYVLDLLPATGASGQAVGHTAVPAPVPSAPSAPVQSASPAVVGEQSPAPVVRPLAKVQQSQTLVVVLDPGHGGIDPGAIGLKNTYEKTIVLDVSKRVQKLLAAYPNVSVHLTRETDKFVKLDERVRFAQRRNADIFVSLHADAHHVRKVRGASVYIVSDKASDQEAARLADSANASDQLAGVNIAHESPEVRSILVDLMQRETLNNSAKLAQSVLLELGDVAKLRKDKILFAGFKVLKAPEIPSILVELAYLSNPEEEEKLRQERHQQALAQAITDGIIAYLRAQHGGV